VNSWCKTYGTAEQLPCQTTLIILTLTKYIYFFIYNLNQQSEFTFYKLMAFFREWNATCNRYRREVKSWEILKLAEYLNRPSENHFARSHLLEHQYRGNFENQGWICEKKRSGHPCVSEEAVRQVEDTFNRRPRESAEGKPQVTHVQNDCAESCKQRLANFWTLRTWVAEGQWIKWPDLSTCDFFLWGFCKGELFCCLYSWVLINWSW
jgi:hypothetical protein